MTIVTCIKPGQAHMQTGQTDLHSVTTAVLPDTVRAPAKTCTQVRCLFLLWSRREHTDLISPS